PTHSSLPHFFHLPTRPPPRSTLFPYTTLFRSSRNDQIAVIDRLLMRPAAPEDGLEPAGVLDAAADLGCALEPGLRSRRVRQRARDRKSTRLNSSHLGISYAVFCLKKKKKRK